MVSRLLKSCATPPVSCPTALQLLGLRAAPPAQRSVRPRHEGAPRHPARDGTPRRYGLPRPATVRRSRPRSASRARGRRTPPSPIRSRRPAPSPLGFAEGSPARAGTGRAGSRRPAGGDPWTRMNSLAWAWLKPISRCSVSKARTRRGIGLHDVAVEPQLRRPVRDLPFEGDVLLPQHPLGAPEIGDVVEDADHVRLT